MKRQQDDYSAVIAALHPEREERRKRRRKTAVMLAALGFVGTFAAGMTVTHWPERVADDVPQVAALSALQSTPMPICSGSMRVTCVVDGDTFWLDGEKIRVADIDAPEVSQPQCASEAELGRQATVRLAELLGEGEIDLRQIGSRDRDQYDRLLRVVVVNGVSVGDRLVAEGLARTWTGRREPWC